MVYRLSFSDLVPAKLMREIAWAMSDPRNIGELERILCDAINRFEDIMAQHQATKHWPGERLHQEALAAGCALLDLALGYARRRASARTGGGVKSREVRGSSTAGANTETFFSSAASPGGR